jgi:hypothetical protein
MPAKGASAGLDRVKRHWETVYSTRGARGVSWYQPVAEVSIALIEELRIPHEAAIVDIGGGASKLAGQLVSQGFVDVTVLDVSTRAMDLARAELGPDATRVHWIEQDLLTWSPRRRYDLWHDRAVFHFLVEPTRRERYTKTMRSAVRMGGTAVIGTFATDGPKSCSGLPVVRYDSADLAGQFGGGFVMLSTRSEEHKTPAGRGQPYTWVALERISR